MPNTASETPELRVQFTKRKDGAVVFRCVRADGSATWQKQEGRHALFFPFHDLTHFVVETTLGFRRAFYGLMAEGWDVDDTTGKGTRGAIPPEAVIAEHLVGLLDRERAGGSPPFTAELLNAQLDQLATEGRIAYRVAFTDAQLDQVRQRLETLQNAWATLPSGETLELTFDRRGQVPAN
jgi:hypothetical protein